MIIIPLDDQLFLLCIGGTLIFEVLRIAIAYFLASDSQELKKARADKIEAQLEIAQIKSVQLEFVKHSLLSRKVIKCDRLMEDINEKLTPKKDRIQLIFRITRMFLYLTAGMYLQDQRVVMLEPSVSFNICNAS
jgi:hypothetical protein